MNHWNSEDPKLVSFLQKYRPNIPPASDELEQSLITKIKQQPQNNNKGLLWMIPSLVAASILLTWGGFRWFNPSQQWANQRENTEELEAFVMDTWYEVTTTPEINNNFEEDLMLLTE